MDEGLGVAAGRERRSVCVARRRAALILAPAGAAAVLLLTLPTSAFGFFSGTASGAGAGGTSSVAEVAFAAGTGGADLVPGGSGAIDTVVRNTSAVDAHVARIELDPSRGDGGFAVDAAHSGCSAASLAFVSPTGGSGWDARAGTSTAVHLASAVALAASAPAACQGASITVYLRAAL